MRFSGCSVLITLHRVMFAWPPTKDQRHQAHCNFMDTMRRDEGASLSPWRRSATRPSRARGLHHLRAVSDAATAAIYLGRLMSDLDVLRLPPPLCDPIAAFGARVLTDSQRLKSLLHMQLARLCARSKPRSVRP